MATVTKAQTIRGRTTFNDVLDVTAYDYSNPLVGAMKSRVEEVGSWNYIESTNTSLTDCTHTITIPRTWGRIGDFWLDVYLPANTYVAHTLTSMIKEIRWNFGNGDPMKFNGEDLDFLLSHANKKVIADLIHQIQGNSTSAVSAATWFSIPLIMLGSKCLFSEEDDLFNTPFELYKMANDLQLEIDFYAYTKYVTTGSNTTGKVRLCFKQYEYKDNWNGITPVNNTGKAVSTSYIMPYILRNYETITCTAGSTNNIYITNLKEDGEIVEILLKLVVNASVYTATAPLRYTTSAIDQINFVLKNTKIYEAWAKNAIKRQYVNEYGHDNTWNVDGTSTYEYYSIDLAETPKMLYSGSVATVGINIINENPKIEIVPATGSSTACTLYEIFVYKSLYVINSNGVIKRYLTL